MASGRLAANLTVAGANVAVYTVPAGKVASFTVDILNTGTADGSVNFLALSTSNSAPDISEYIEISTLVSVGNLLERSGLVLDGGKSLVISTSTPFSVVVYGYEE